MKFNFLKSTIIFCAIGIVIPGFTAIVFFLFQMLFEKLGIDCETYWKAVIIITSIISVSLPIIYFKHLDKYRKPTQANLLLFNFIEYSCLQISFVQFFISSKSICFGQSDGGLVLVLTAWIGLPILFCLSLFFHNRFKN